VATCWSDKETLVLFERAARNTTSAPSLACKSLIGSDSVIKRETFRQNDSICDSGAALHRFSNCISLNEARSLLCGNRNSLKSPGSSSASIDLWFFRLSANASPQAKASKKILFDWIWWWSIAALPSLSEIFNFIRLLWFSSPSRSSKSQGFSS